VLPRDIVAKDELLKYFKEVYGRNDIVINRVESTKKIDRTLSSNQNDFSNHLWTASGYKSAPTVQQMVQEQFDFNQSHV
jgi:hypothetical protein